MTSRGSEESASSLLDFRGEDCPGPLIKALRVFARLKRGESLTVLTDVEECVRLLKENIQEAGLGRVNVYRRQEFFEVKIIRDY